MLAQAFRLALELRQKLAADISATQQDHIDVRGVAEKRGMTGAHGRLRRFTLDHHGNGAFGGSLREHFHVDTR